MPGKTNKSFAKRLKLTNKGKVLSRRPGQDHFKAKEPRKTQLHQKKLQDFNISKKDLGKYLPFN